MRLVKIMKSTYLNKNNNFKASASLIESKSTEPENKFDTLSESAMFNQHLAQEVFDFNPISSAVSTIKTFEDEEDKKRYNEIVENFFKRCLGGRKCSEDGSKKSTLVLSKQEIKDKLKKLYDSLQDAHDKDRFIKLMLDEKIGSEIFYTAINGDVQSALFLNFLELYCQLSNKTAEERISYSIEMGIFTQNDIYKMSSENIQAIFSCKSLNFI